MNISQYAKTAASVAGGIVAWGTAAATLFALVPDKRIATLVTVLLFIVHASQSFTVWLARNEPLVDAASEAVAKVVSMVTDWSGTIDELKAVVRKLFGEAPSTPS
jgi:hypothetical protein